MKAFSLLCLLLTFKAWSGNNLKAEAVNSPVKGKELRVELTPPKNYFITGIEYVIYSEQGKPLSTPVTWKKGEVTNTGTKPVAIIKVALTPGKYKAHLKTNPEKGKNGVRSVKVSFEISEAKEVPHPGEDGKKTLLGIDTDNDGVRDDVQIWIDQKYPPSLKPNTNLAVRQLARYSQLELQFHADKEKVIPVHLKTLETLHCLMWVNDKGISISKEIEGQMLNTRERIKAFIKVDSYFDGSNTPANIMNTKWDEMDKFCEFAAIKE
jgi:hypothetical protein